VDQIVLKALAKNPQERYQNASEFEKDLHAVLYTYQPSPGPADLAIYMHRLLETPQASDAEIDAAFDAARDMARLAGPPAAAPLAPSKKGKGLVISKTGEFARPAVPAPEPRPEPATRRAVGESATAPALFAAGESKKSRAGLVAGIGVAAAVLVAGALFFTKDRWAGAKPSEAVPAPNTDSLAAASLAAATAAPSPLPPAPEPARIVDPKAVEAEARRLGGEREKALREAAAKQAGTAGKPAAASAPAPAVLSLAPVKAAEPPRADEVPAASPKPVEPAAEPSIARAQESRPAEPVAEPVSRAAPPPPAEVSVPENPPVIPAASSVPVKEGDVVGPGEGVVEPRLVRLGVMSSLPAQARQIKRGADGSIGTPYIMALVDERGVVQEIRVIKPSKYKFVDDAAVRALKGATILPATKDGVKVKMWKTFPISVVP
jgi:TonB family protein